MLAVTTQQWPLRVYCTFSQITLNSSTSYVYIAPVLCSDVGYEILFATLQILLINREDFTALRLV